jgi:hypothetical protein
MTEENIDSMWNIPLDKLIVTQVVTRFPIFYETRKLKPDPSLSQQIQDYKLTHSSWTIHFNIIL